MKVFGLTTGADTAGINYAIASAFRRHAPSWHVNCMVASQNYIGYPVDVPWRLSELHRLYDEAEVVHLHSTLHGHRWYDNGQGKPIVLMHHGMHDGGGTPFAKAVEEGRRVGAVQVGSTLDLAIREPEVKWLPAPANLAELRRLRAQHYRPGKTLRIGHAPTNRAIKGSDTFDRAILTLQREGLSVEPVVIERVQWSECLKRKATCDLFWDQPVLGYGSNAIEAWAMGIPVVSGVADPMIREGMVHRWGRLPFFEASEATLTDALRLLVRDAELRAEFARIGTTHVERWHDERVTVESLKTLYANVPASVPSVTLRAVPRQRPQRRVVMIGRPYVPRVQA